MDRMSVRNKMIELRSDMTSAKVTRLSATIADRLDAAVAWKKVKTAHIYRSVDTWKEVRTSEIITVLQAHHSSVNLTVGSPHRYSSLPDSQFDLIILPLLAFDTDLNRLGFGGGWYDRFLAKQGDALKVGVAYDFQRIEMIEAHTHDIPLDMVITESRVFTR